jgi:mRNA interferase RelE/StbE
MPPPYTIITGRAVERFLAKHRQDIDRIDARIRLLTGDLLPGDAKPLQGAHNHFRIRIGDYRVLYAFEPETNTIAVYAITRREDAYGA